MQEHKHILPITSVLAVPVAGAGMPVQGCLKTKNKSQKNSEKICKKYEFSFGQSIDFSYFCIVKFEGKAMQQDTKNPTTKLTAEQLLAIREKELAALVERLAATEKKLDLEKSSREEIIAREMAEEREALRAEVKEEFKEEYEALEREKKDLARQRESHRQEMELMAVRLCAQLEREYAEKKDEILRSSIFQIKDIQEIVVNALAAAIEGNAEEGEACMQRLRDKMPEARKVLEDEVREALNKAEKKGARQTHHITELVRMLFTRKSERVELGEEEHETLMESVLKSVKLTETEKEEHRQCYRKIKEYRERKRLAETLENKTGKGHGRKPIPDSMPRLAPITLYPEGYEGHESEYRMIGCDVQEFILPVSVRYVVQPIERPVVVRKDDPLEKPQQSPCYEGPIWKSNASAELLAQIECGKYLYHMPFYRQTKKMKAEGFEISNSTIDGWHQEVCRMLEALYELQRQRVMQSRLLAADGSPMPVIDNEKQRTVKQYIIQYRSIDTGVPVFISTPGSGSGRGKAVIEANLGDWTGSALMCDAYSGYDWVGKAGRVLCRCAAHMRRGFERAMSENPNVATPAMALIQDIYAVEAIAKMRGLEGSGKTALRRELAGPNWELLKLWCMEKIVELPEDTLTYKAMGYLLRHYDELTAYLDIADMPVDNNDTERAIRSMVMGKQSYLFCRNDEACQRAAIMYSMLGACKVLGKDPEKWLAYTLKHIGSTKPEHLHRLLPEEWTE